MDEKPPDVGVEPDDLSQAVQPLELVRWHRRDTVIARLDLDLCQDSHIATCDTCGQERGCRVLRYGPVVIPTPPTTQTPMRRGLRLCARCFTAYLDEQATA